jgi:hypothetical protein
MKSRHWLALSALYMYLCTVAYAISYDWDWLEGTTETVSFSDRWLVNTAQVSTIGAPFIVGAVVLGFWIAEGLSDAVRGR